MGRIPLTKRVGTIAGIMVLGILFMAIGWLLFPPFGTLYLLLLALVLGVGVLGIAIEVLNELRHQWRKLVK